MSSSSNEDEQTFLMHFRCYIEHDQEKDFVIDLDDVIQYMGFTRKDVIKRILSKHFQEEQDYRVSKLLHISAEQDHLLEKKPINGGHNKERILMTPMTFKELCIKANTNKAHQIRMYYIRMENILFKYLNETIQSLTDSKKCLEKEIALTCTSFQNKIDLLEKEVAKFKARDRKKYDYGDTVYVVKDGRVYKVGSALNMNNREETYYCHSTRTRIVYTKRCKSRKALEDAVHHRLAQYTYMNRKDWFTCDFTTIRTAIDELQRALDGEESAFTFDKDALDSDNDEIDDKIDDVRTNCDSEVEEDGDVEQDTCIPNDEEITGSDSNTNVLDTQPPAVDDTEEENMQSKTKYKKPLIKPNFEKFISECFTVDENTITTWVDIGARYKIWSKSTCLFKTDLYAFMKQHGYKETFFLDKTTCTLAKAFRGLKMIPLPPFRKPKKPNEIEQFVFECCTRNITGRISCKDLDAAFATWKGKQKEGYTKITKEDKKNVDKFFADKFFATTVHTGERMRFGYLGVSLKGHEHVGRKFKPNNRKQIEQYNPETMEVVQTFNSITEASIEFGMSISAVSLALTKQRKVLGYCLRYTTDNKAKKD